MNQYCIDMHVHTGEVSPCGRVKARKVVRMYHEAGYHGIVITDHFYDGFFESLTGLTWTQKIDRFLHGYREAAEEGSKIGLYVLLGAEFRFPENFNDYLIYGLDTDFLYKHPKLYSLGLNHFSKQLADTDILIYQAHPFRAGIVPADPLLIQGVEVFNGNPRHDSRNHLAYQYAAEHRLKMVSGSDFHQPQDVGTGGIAIAERINDATELSRLLKKDPIIDYLGLK
jgi:predicted metal-dependent phosphoesterase TrpH